MNSCLLIFLRRPINAVNSSLQLLAALDDCICSLSFFTMICVTSRLLYIKTTNMSHFAAPDWSETFTAECYQHVQIFYVFLAVRFLLQILNPGGPNGLIVKHDCDVLDSGSCFRIRDVHWHTLVSWWHFVSSGASVFFVLSIALTAWRQSENSSLSLFSSCFLW